MRNISKELCIKLRVKYSKVEACDNDEEEEEDKIANNIEVHSCEETTGRLGQLIIG